ncbi:DUF6428 family protein [Aestuariivirga litoralis]|uniref:DUF6428 family protein n=1 Tax=Aestuariivirga litoralis TaxID=2650924 RepID=UPI0018C60DE0|nr:DUF6428 family protein [Aestuariivirga litoralis]MBG1230834.1 hypothetical protein [Aestuariivirga litoralis]
MNANASVLLPKPEIEKSLAEMLSTLAPHADKPLVIEYAGRRVQPGYHVTEVKAGSFATLDCGGNPDAWQETILQVEDIPAEDGQTFMNVGKFRSILAKVGTKISLDNASRLTFEISSPDTPMQIFDVESVTTDASSAVLHLKGRAAICKPRHRAERALPSSCCTSKPATGNANCCA